MASSRALKTINALDQHRTALAACRLCGHQGIVPIVSEAVGARVMLVGQAPGKVESSGGRPFAGRAGRTLFQWLAEAGVDEATVRAKIYIAAVTRCYPGPSPSGRGDRVPGPRERELCRRWLDAELQIIRPEVIIPVGRLAIDLFLPAASLDSVIGREHRTEHAGGESVVIPLPHPSGASSWIHLPGHRALLQDALAHLRVRLADLLYL